MKIKVFDKEWKVTSIVYKQKRELWQLSMLAFPEGKVVQVEYFKLIQKVEEISGLTEKDYVHKDGNDLTMAEIDLLLQEIFSAYMGVEKKA